MTSITIYTPFTYCITFLPTGQRYYGVRYAKGCHPDQLWTTYFTSSKIITGLIEEHSKDSFSTQIRKTFTTPEQACSWETKFLTRINAAKHPDWINGNNANGNFISTPETVQKGLETRKRNGTLNVSSPESIQKQKDTRKKNGTEHNMKNPETVQKMIDTKIKNGTTNPNTPESIQKRKDTMKKNGTTNNSTPESIQKCKNTRLKNGIPHPMKNPENVQKAKDTRKRNGTTNPNTPESIQKAKDTKKERGVINPALIPFLSMIHNKKTYSKSNISKYFSELKQYY